MSRDFRESQPASNSDNARRARRIVWVILLLGIVLQLVRILQVHKDGESPFLSANDKSRWCTIAALSISGKYEIDEIKEIKAPNSGRRIWYSIDMVRHQGADGKQHYYSSKPPLLPTIYAGVYMGFRRVSGLSLMKHTFAAVRWMLVLVNLLPLVLLWWICVHKAKSELGERTWSIIVLSLLAVFGTFLTTFVVTINNHLPGAVAIGVSLFCLDRIALEKRKSWFWFVLCGVSTSFATSCEFPALAWLIAVGGILLLIDWRRTALWYLPALLPVTIAFFATNYVAHGVLRPPYVHRSLGEKLFDLPVDAKNLSDSDYSELKKAFASRAMSLTKPQLRPARHAGYLILWDEQLQKQFTLQPTSEGVSVYQCDDWYDYPNTYWIAGKKTGVDLGEPSSWIYAFHCLIGHHGVFSLTPIWFVSLLGVAPAAWFSRKVLTDPRNLIKLMIVLTSAACIAFYLSRSLDDRNYGGVTSGLRWIFWLIPLWYWLAIDGIKRVQSFGARRLVEFALALSIFSATWPWINPWTHPWIMQWWSSVGWVNY